MSAQDPLRAALLAATADAHAGWLLYESERYGSTGAKPSHTKELVDCQHEVCVERLRLAAALAARTPREPKV